MRAAEACRWASALCLAAACSGQSSDRAAGASKPGGPPLVIDGALVREIARSSAVTAERAAAIAAEDALLAEYLLREQPRAARALESVALARALIEKLGAEARQAGAPSDAELREIQRERWWELDRPRMRRLLHAVVLSDVEDPAARALAERIRAAVVSKENTEFRKTARAVDPGGFTVKAEILFPMAPDGRAVDLENPPPDGPRVQHFAPEFAGAALRLTRAGETSPVVRTPFGYHVIRLTRIFEPQSSKLEELRTSLAAEVIERRARAAIDDVLSRQRREAAPEQERSAVALMGQFEPAP